MGFFSPPKGTNSETGHRNNWMHRYAGLVLDAGIPMPKGAGSGTVYNNYGFSGGGKVVGERGPPVSKTAKTAKEPAKPGECFRAILLSLANTVVAAKQ
jgi:hypothetical protein